MRPTAASTSDAASMAALWHLVFGDEPTEIRAFLNRFLPTDTALIVKDGQSVVAMLFLIEASLNIGDRTETVGYIYAGATHPSYRGRGLYRSLLAKAECHARQRDMAALFLQPADEPLALTYERMGFTIPMVSHPSCGTRGADDAVKIDTTAFAVQRKARLTAVKTAFIEWPDRVYDHMAAWSDTVVLPCGALALVTKDTDAVILEQIDTMSVHGRAIGRMKPLNPSVLTMQPIYMGYGMD